MKLSEALNLSKRREALALLPESEEKDARIRVFWASDSHIEEAHWNGVQTRMSWSALSPEMSKKIDTLDWSPAYQKDPLTALAEAIDDWQEDEDGE